MIHADNPGRKKLSVDPILVLKGKVGSVRINEERLEWTEEELLEMPFNKYLEHLDRQC